MEEIIKSELAFTNGLVIIVLFFIALMALYLDKLRRDKIAIKNSLERIEDNYKNIYEILVDESMNQKVLINTHHQLNDAIKELISDETDNQLVLDYTEQSLINTKKLLGIHRGAKLHF